MMALVVICGQPCSGKSTVAETLKARFLEKAAAVVVVDEPSLHLDKNVSYKGISDRQSSTRYQTLRPS